jgi:RNA polymerase sigma-70 factor (ECF subfamily)
LSQAEEDLEGLMRSKALDAAAKEERAKEQKEKLELVNKAMGKIGDPCRQILELRNREGVSYIEISRLLKIPMGTVMSRLARCTAALKEEVEKLLKKGLQ